MPTSRHYEFEKQQHSGTVQRKAVANLLRYHRLALRKGSLAVESIVDVGIAMQLPTSS